MTHSSPGIERLRVALCERLIGYSDDIHCVAVHRDLAKDLREAEACITLLADQIGAPAQAAPDYRQALENARQEIVLAVAFLNRDIATKRLDITATQLCTRLTNADAAIRETLATPPQAPRTACGCTDGCKHKPGCVFEQQSAAAPQAARAPWKGDLSVDLRKGALGVNADGVTLIDEAGTCWAIVFPDKTGSYDHASTIVAALSRPPCATSEKTDGKQS